MNVSSNAYAEFSSQKDSIDFLNDCAEFVLPGSKKSNFEAMEHSDTKLLAKNLEQRVGSSVGAFMQFNGVPEELATACKMLKRYPWHGTDISKSSHLEMTWFLVQNLCYHFKEKTKLYFNNQKSAALILRLPEPMWLKAELKLIDDIMGKAIKDRGNTVHGWNTTENSIYTYSLVETIVEAGEESGDWDLKSHYRDAKFFLGWKARKYRDHAYGLMWRCFRDHSPTPPTLVRRFNELTDAVLNKGALLTQKENGK
ncbi:hypothetical protein [Tropicibacter sp. Alg240-R139]|uniref:hypothetical protein n=1 Tax=Tropicibacter sp. Alg240-R139 TaxID=2305991 RepID=UPI0013E0BEC4|nr:hypothetical protein [Tropicibacter sp. Alg240-R139]